MLLDWFTVGAQAVNFLVLLWLLKHFLYGPILNTIAAREKRVADEAAETIRQKTDAERIRRDLSAKTLAFDTTGAALLAKAAHDAAIEHDRQMAVVRTEGDALRLKQNTLLQGERTAQRDEFNRLVTREVFAIARRALGDLAGAQVEEPMVHTLLQRLGEMPPDRKALWSAALREPLAAGVVRSRFVLDASQRALIQKAVDAGGPASVPLQYETASETVCGIEIIVQGLKISWTVSDYLKSLQAEVDTLVAAPPPPMPALAVAS